MRKLFNIVIVLLLVLNLAMFIRIIFLRIDYNRITSTTKVTQQKNNINYSIQVGESKQYLFLVGDLLGSNQKSYELVKETKANKNQSVVFLSGIKKNNFYLDSREDFLNLISSSNKVVLPDNFCTKDWERLQEKEIYQKASLSPGLFCSSESETMLIDNLIKRYHPKEVVIYYDTKNYLDFIDNFLVYLKENNIEYNLKASIDETKN